MFGEVGILDFLEVVEVYWLVDVILESIIIVIDLGLHQLL